MFGSGVTFSFSSSITCSPLSTTMTLTLTQPPETNELCMTRREHLAQATIHCLSWSCVAHYIIYKNVELLFSKVMLITWPKRKWLGWGAVWNVRLWLRCRPYKNCSSNAYQYCGHKVFWSLLLCHMRQTYFPVAVVSGIWAVHLCTGLHPLCFHCLVVHTIPTNTSTTKTF